MSAEKITLTHYECRCELSDCPGHGKLWISRDPMIPERCAFCGRRTWNGRDKRKNVVIVAHGKTLRLSEWAKETGLSAQLIHARLKAGWTEENSVSIPVGKRRPLS
jgi:hypothetical protein